MFDRPKVGERALLLHLKLPDPRRNADVAEFKELVLSSGAQVVELIVCRVSSIDVRTIIGKGKLFEICELVQLQRVDLVIINYSLKPAQERNLEKHLQCRVLDRTGLILDIFAARARTFEGKLQVELAQLQHLSTRLVRGWTHLERQRGGIGLRGPGEKQLEVDRRVIRNRIRTIQLQLEKVRKQRQQSRRARTKAMVPTVILVGYTNSGKSTLFNTLTGAETVAANKPFVTLDPLLRTIFVPMIGKVILADTVGFIRELPHDLVEAFKATLEEIKLADLLVHVIDVSDDLWLECKQQVEAVLYEIGALDVPVLDVYNKIDLCTDGKAGYQNDYRGSIIVNVRVSALQNQGIDYLRQAIGSRLCHDVVRCEVRLPASCLHIKAALYEFGAVDRSAVDMDTGDLLLHISVQQQRWQSICRKFTDLPKYVVKT